MDVKILRPPLYRPTFSPALPENRVEIRQPFPMLHIALLKLSQAATPSAAATDCSSARYPYPSAPRFGSPPPHISSLPQGHRSRHLPVRPCSATRSKTHIPFHASTGSPSAPPSATTSLPWPAPTDRPED